jgi:hypothetical protein
VYYFLNDMAVALALALALVFFDSFFIKKYTMSIL